MTERVADGHQSLGREDQPGVLRGFKGSDVKQALDEIF